MILSEKESDGIWRAGILLLAAVLIASPVLRPGQTQAATGLVITNGAGGQGTNAWTNPANAQGTTEANYASATPPNNGRIAGIWNNYGFDTSLPLHAAITKVEIIPQYKVNSTLGAGVLEVQAVVGGTNCPTVPVSDSSEPTADTDFPVDVTSCRIWTRDNLLNANFGSRVTAFRNGGLFGVTITLDYVRVRVTYDTPDYEQADYRWFDNSDSTLAGSALTPAQNSAPSLYAPRDRLRLRVLLHVTTTKLISGSEQFKLQYAQKGASCAASTFNDVTAGSIIAYYNNPIPTDSVSLTTLAGDPVHAGDALAAVAQSYEESSPIITLNDVAAGRDGLWDIVLVANGALANTSYCFRLVKNDGTALTTYSVYPEIVTSPSGTLNVDIVDAGGSSVGLPSFDFGALTTPFTCATSTASLGTASQRIRLKNTTDTPGWTVSIAATAGSGALWSAGTPKYDFNDGAGSPAGCSAGLDSDIYGGQMTIDASGGSLSARSVTMCNTTGITKGASAAFSEGALNAITLVSGSASAATGCYWELANVSVSQRIPGGQQSGSYSINMTATVVAN